jgi:hypothetical protein
MTDTEGFAPLIFQYSIALGVRKHDDARKAQLDAILKEKRPEIEALLARYAIPTVPMPVTAGSNGAQAAAAK